MILYLCRSLCHAYVLLDPLVVPIYLTLSVLAPLAITDIWWWKTLASHGKTTTIATKQQVALRRAAPPHAASASVSYTPIRKTMMYQQDTGGSWKDLFLKLYNTFYHVILDEDGVGWVPKRWFSHFYLVGMLNLFLCVACPSSGTCGDGMSNSSNPSPLVWLIALHLIRRYWECRCIHVWRIHSRMHVAGYLLGILHYVLLPLVFCRMGTLNTTTMPLTPMGGYHHLTFPNMASVSLCLWAQYQQYQHHAILAHLRQQSHHAETHRKNETKRTVSSQMTSYYNIPIGAWFQCISCPHYLAEILIYASWAILQQHEFQSRVSQSSSSSTIQVVRHWILLLWVVINLTVSAITTHQWYLRQFPDVYPKLQRRAIFPGIL